MRISRYHSQKTIRVGVQPLETYPYWVIDLQQKATYYRKTKEKLEATGIRLLIEDKSKTFIFCPNYNPKSNKTN